jgi:hypothetical protein
VTSPLLPIRTFSVPHSCVTLKSEQLGLPYSFKLCKTPRSSTEFNPRSSTLSRRSSSAVCDAVHFNSPPTASLLHCTSTTFNINHGGFKLSVHTIAKEIVPALRGQRCRKTGVGMPQEHVASQFWPLTSMLSATLPSSARSWQHYLAGWNHICIRLPEYHYVVLRALQ